MSISISSSVYFVYKKKTSSISRWNNLELCLSQILNQAPRLTWQIDALWSMPFCRVRVWAINIIRPKYYNVMKTTPEIKAVTLFHIIVLTTCVSSKAFRQLLNSHRICREKTFFSIKANKKPFILKCLY